MSFQSLLFWFPALLACSAAAGGDLAQYHTDKPEARIANMPGDIREAIFSRPVETIEPLVRWLLRDESDDFRKVKLLHDWIADNIDYDVEAYLAGQPGETLWKDTLVRRKAFCQGYAELFQKMCQIAGIPSEVISGWGRGYGFAIGRTDDIRRSNHAWNAVNIQQRWRLVDVTWDAGHVAGTKYQKQYGTAYLFADPRSFLHTHFPTDAKWQLLDRPATARNSWKCRFSEAASSNRGCSWFRQCGDHTRWKTPFNLR